MSYFVSDIRINMSIWWCIAIGIHFSSMEFEKKSFYHNICKIDPIELIDRLAEEVLEAS